MDEELRRLRDAVAGVPGWLAAKEGANLYRLAKRCTGAGAIVEIGSWRGKSTICLALGSKAGRGAPVYSVDRHTDKTFADFTENVARAGVADLVRPIRAKSLEAAPGFDEAIELLFIDAGHEYEDVKADFEAWVPKLIEGGTLVLHDTTWFPGPKRVADELVFKSGRFKDARFVVSSTTVGTKVRAATLGDRARNRIALAGKLAFELAAKTRRHVPSSVESAARRLLGVSWGAPSPPPR